MLCQKYMKEIVMQLPSSMNNELVFPTERAEIRTEIIGYKEKEIDNTVTLLLTHAT